MIQLAQFKGVFTALITPFAGGKVDFASLENLLQFQLKNQIDGFVVGGTTAESPTITEKEKEEIFKFIKQRVPKNFPLLVGTGTNSTAATIRDTQRAEKWGADGSLVVVPYYNKPPQRGLFEHFKAVADNTQIPVILYNVPARTACSLELETIRKLAEHPQIVGIKEASGNIEFAQKIRAACGNQFILFSGDDVTYQEFMKAGKGDGAISVAAHILPKAVKDVMMDENLELIKYLFIEANPIPVKMALFHMKIIRSPELRLPLVAMTGEKEQVLQKLLMAKGLIK